MRKKRAELLSYLLGSAAPALEDELAAWLEASSRYERFLSANRDKIRKKLRTAGDDEALRDVRAELLVASRLVGERRFEVEYEAYGSGAGKPHGGVAGRAGVPPGQAARQGGGVDAGATRTGGRRTRAVGKRGPDLTVTFRANQRFNVEVTRLRPSGGNEVSRLQGVLLVKCRQLPPLVPNVIALVSSQDTVIQEDTLASAAKQLKQLADRKDEVPFIRRRYENARDFLGYLARLSGVLVLPEGSTDSDGAALWLSPLARQSLPREIITALARVTGSTP